jgi:hypothetical protein
MKLLKLLNNKVGENLIREFSDKLVQKLMQKFKSETSDDDRTILSYINDFEKYKESLPADQRNIETYKYNDLKSLIDVKRNKADMKKALTFFKKNSKGHSQADILRTIRKFMELSDFLPKNQKDITKFNYLDLVGFMEKNFENAMKKILQKKFAEDSTFTPDQANFYINQVFNIYDRIPLDSKLVSRMNVEEIEHLVDGLSDIGKEDAPQSKDMSKIDLLYDENNLKVFAPKTKDECILLRNGRSWCTSRDGSSNLYYNYRLNNNLTLYYVIDEDLPYSDVNFASVILVETNGEMRLADGTNSGTYSGHSTIPWRDIVVKIPKIAQLKELFKPVPLTEEEKEQIRKVKSVSVGSNPIKSFDGDESLVELWMEINSPTLTDDQYMNIPDNLKKKYIALGFSLSPNQLNNSNNNVLEYYISRKIKLLETKSLRELSQSDLDLLNIPLLKTLKERLKKSFAEKIIVDGNKLVIDDIRNSEVGKFISLYGLDSLIDSLPSNLEELKLKNKDKDGLIINIPESVNRFKNLNMILLDNCVDRVPDSICDLPNLRFLSLLNNNKLTTIPECVVNLPKLLFVNLKGSDNVNIPDSFKDKAIDMGKGYWDMGGF